MINVGTLYKTLNDLLSKNNYQNIATDEYNRYLQLAVMDLFDDLRGNKNRPTTTYGIDRNLDRRLNPFKVKANLSFAANVATKPTNLAQIRAIYVISTKIPVKPIDEDRYANLHRNPLASPNTDDIWYIEEETQLTLLGTTPTLACEILYLRYPTTPLYAYTLVDGRAVYNDGASVHIEFDKNMEGEIVNRLLAYMGLSGRDNFVTQVANANKSME